MSTVFRSKNLRFQILTNDHEPAHVHVYGPGAEAKIEIESLTIVSSKGFSKKALSEIVDQVSINQSDLLEKWKEYHGKDED